MTDAGELKPLPMSTAPRDGSWIVGVYEGGHLSPIIWADDPDDSGHTGWCGAGNFSASKEVKADIHHVAGDPIGWLPLGGHSRVTLVLNDGASNTMGGRDTDNVLAGIGNSMAQGTLTLSEAMVQLQRRYLDASAQSNSAYQTDPEFEADEDGNPLWKCEIQTAGGHAIVAEVYGANKAEAEARGEAIASVLSGQSPAALSQPTRTPPFCSTCGCDVTEVLCEKCSKWWQENPPPTRTAADIRAEALEEAARVADAAASDWRGDDYKHARNAAIAIGSDIRALKQKDE